MVNDILKLSDLESDIPTIINFCELYGQKDLIPIFKKAFAS